MTNDATPGNVPLSDQLGRLPTVARLYYTGQGSRRYKRASVHNGPGEALTFVSLAEERVRQAVALECERLRAELERLRAENAALKRDLQYARDGLTKGRTRMREDNERLREALRAVLAWGTDENYERARAACSRARDMLRTTDAKTDRPSTPVGWSDTDWLAHLERLQQNEAAYAKGPLPERGWD